MTQQSGGGTCVRCSWAGTDARMIAYHDTEWGRPVHDDRVHFEFLILETAQAGLSWSTVLNKRDGYRRAFSDLDPEKVARFGAKKVEALMLDSGIIRNRLKITGAIHNAKEFLKIQDVFESFDNYCWKFVEGKPQKTIRRTKNDVPVTTVASDAFSKDLKKRGFKFVGSTIMYAYMQAVGMVNDHTVGCICCDLKHLPFSIT